jgi:hypothetical protein
MRRARTTACLLAAGLVLALPGCGESDPAEGLLSNVDKARSAKSLAALQTALVTLGLIQADAAGDVAGGDVAAALQAKDPTNRYTTAPPTDAGMVQVTGGGGAPVMLTTINSAPASGRAPVYLAAWQGDGTTMYYAGAQPPPYSSSVPAGAGWSATPPQ